MRGLGFVQPQGVGDGFEHFIRDAGEVSAFQPGVVIDADGGQGGHLLAPQPGTRRLLPTIRFTCRG